MKSECCFGLSISSPHIPDGESFSCNTFCQLACGMLKAIGNFLNSEIDEVVRRMFVYEDGHHGDLRPALGGAAEDGASDDGIIEDEAAVTRHQVYEACRGFQSVFGEARERSVKALAFAKTLRKDLEVSAEFTVSSEEALMDRLLATGHVRVVAPHSSAHQIFISG